jgi:undecaprenyl phosphate N,N'-diacetylbacillosamine 1-phosphate transferase
MAYKLYIKPVGDFLMALCLFIILIPVFVLVISILFIKNNKVVFFLQDRIGKDGKIFTILKFSTMSNGNLPDSQRITKIGKILRKYSIDEIPQLLNVLKGDMSLIGPRPLLPEYLLLYNQEQKRRHLVKPGITGLAQINGRNKTTWEERFYWDVKYVENISMELDIKILFKTIYRLLTDKTIHGDIISEKFLGNN